MHAVGWCTHPAIPAPVSSSAVRQSEGGSSIHMENWSGSCLSLQHARSSAPADAIGKALLGMDGEKVAELLVGM